MCRRTSIACCETSEQGLASSSGVKDRHKPRFLFGRLGRMKQGPGGLQPHLADAGADSWPAAILWAVWVSKCAVPLRLQPKQIRQRLAACLRWPGGETAWSCGSHAMQPSALPVLMSSMPGRTCKLASMLHCCKGSLPCARAQACLRCGYFRRQQRLRCDQSTQGLQRIAKRSQVLTQLCHWGLCTAEQGETPPAISLQTLGHHCTAGCRAAGNDEPP